MELATIYEGGWGASDVTPPVQKSTFFGGTAVKRRVSISMQVSKVQQRHFNWVLPLSVVV